MVNLTKSQALESIRKEGLCPECKGAGIVYVKFQGFRTCWRCLHAHKLDTPELKSQEELLN